MIDFFFVLFATTAIPEQVAAVVLTPAPTSEKIFVMSGGETVA